MRVRARALILPITLGALLIAGCGDGGDGGGDGGPDPASLAPVASPLYLEAAVQPEGSVREDALGALGTMLDDDNPGGRLRQEVDRSLREARTGTTFRQDIQPWLGERAGLFLSGLGGDSAIAIATDDPDQALAAADRAAKRTDPRQQQRSYKGVEFKVDSGFDAHGVIGDFLVFGDARGFRAAVDASQGKSLADDTTFQGTLAKSRGTALAGLYLRLGSLLGGAEGDDPAAALRSRVLGAALGATARQPIVATVTPAEDSVTLDVNSAAPPGAGPPKPSEALLNLPSDAWAGLGLTNLAATLGDAVKAAEASGEEGTGAEELRATLDAATGLDLDEDILAWPQDLGLFAQGTTLEEFGVALLVFSSDAVLSQRAIAKLAQQAREGTLAGAGELDTADEQTTTTTTPTTPVPVPPGTEAPTGPIETAPIGGEGFTLSFAALPEPIEIQASDDRVVIGYGTATDRALEPPAEQTLGDTALFKQATSALGQGFAINGVVSFPPALTLLASTALADDPRFKRTRPFLAGLSFLALGSSRTGDRSTLRAVIGLK